MDFKNIHNIEIDGIDFNDAHDFCDAFICYAEYNGIPMTEDQLDVLNDDSEFVHEQVFKHLY